MNLALEKEEKNINVKFEQQILEKRQQQKDGKCLPIEKEVAGFRENYQSK